MSRSSDQRYNQKMKRELAELHNKNRELKISMAYALIDLERGHHDRARGTLEEALGIGIAVPVSELEALIMMLQKAKQESERHERQADNKTAG